MIPNPLKDWYSDKKKQDRLIEIMTDPVMKEAMALLHYIKIPLNEGGVLPSSEQIGQSALKHNQDIGYFEYPREMWNLTELPQRAPVMPEPYSDNHVRSHAVKMGWWQDFPEEPSQTTTDKA